MKRVDRFNVSAVYCIVNTKNNRRYVGSSINCKRRIVDHVCILKKNSHANNELQDDWNKYGETNFKFEILCEIKDPRLLRKAEEKYIKQQEGCYNKIKTVKIKGYRNDCNHISKGVIQYKPTDENRAFLLKEQFKKNQKGSYLGLNRIVDLVITEMRKKETRVIKG